VTGRRLLIGLFVLMLPLVTPKVRGADEIQYFSHLRSMVFDHDLDFANEYQHFYDRDPAGLAGFRATFLERREPVTQRHINYAPIGCAVLWAPFYLLAHVGVLAARLLGAGILADGFSTPYMAAACYASALYGFIGLLLTHDGLQRWGGVSEGAATATVVALWWGSPLLYYMTLAATFSHATSVFMVALLLWLTLRAGSRATWNVGEAAVIGLVGGLAALVYEKELLNLVVPGLLLGVWTLRTRRFGHGLRAGVAMGAALIAGFAPQYLAYKSLNGSYGPSSLVRRKMIYWSPHFFEVLFDPGHGMFLWAPLLAFAVGGLIVLALGRREATTFALLAAFVLQIWICGAVDSWHQGGAFGSRRFVSATPVLAFGLAVGVGAVWQRWGRAVACGLVAVFVWWNVSLMVQFGLKLMDRQQLEWPRVAQNQVVEVPRRIVRVGWLFFTDRERLIQETR
jgi:hypothetical protein